MIVKLWMKEDPVTVKANDFLVLAMELMKEHVIRRLPVVDEQAKLVGIISKQDIYNAMPSVIDGSELGSSTALFETTRVEDVMTKNPVCADALMPLEVLAQGMRKHKYGGTPVLEDGKLVGIITESDVFAAFMEIMGFDRSGYRLELIIGKSPRELYSVLDIFKRYDMRLQSFAIHEGFGVSQILVTTKVDGDEFDEMIESLRGAKIQIHRISEGEDI